MAATGGAQETAARPPLPLLPCLPKLGLAAAPEDPQRHAIPDPRSRVSPFASSLAQAPALAWTARPLALSRSLPSPHCPFSTRSHGDPSQGGSDSPVPRPARCRAHWAHPRIRCLHPDGRPAARGQGWHRFVHCRPLSQNKPRHIVGVQ